MRKLLFGVCAAALALLALQPSYASQQYRFTMNNETDVYAHFHVWDKSQVQPHKFCVRPHGTRDATFKGPVIIVDVLAYKEACSGPGVGRGTLNRKAGDAKDSGATFSGSPSNYRLRWS
jgi:hypothetical protein